MGPMCQVIRQDIAVGWYPAGVVEQGKGGVKMARLKNSSEIVC